MKGREGGGITSNKRTGKEQYKQDRKNEDGVFCASYVRGSRGIQDTVYNPRLEALHHA